MTNTDEIPNPNRLLLCVEEVAQLLGIGRTKVYELIRGGQVHSVSVGRRRLVSRNEVERYVERLEGCDG